jgi:hypothetical protein
LLFLIFDSSFNCILLLSERSLAFDNFLSHSFL